MPLPAIDPYQSRAPRTETMAPAYITHPSLTMRSPGHYAFPSSPRHPGTDNARRISSPDHRFKPEKADSPFAMHSVSPLQRRASTPDTMLGSPYDPQYHNPRTPDTTKSRHTDGRFPGPLRIPDVPRFLLSPSPSPHDNPSSTFSTSSRSKQPFFSPTSPPMSSWRDTPERLPPIRRIDPSSPRDDLPHLSSARWHDRPFALKPSPSFLETRSPSPSSPEVEEVGLPSETRLSFGSSRYDYPPKVGTLSHRRDTAPHGGVPRAYKPHDFNIEADGHRDSLRSRTHGRYSEDVERQYGSSGSSQRRGSVSTSQSAYSPRSESCSHRSDSPPLGSSRSKTKFGVRKGSRFFCTYVSPLTGERCDIWDKGWTVYATLVRHAEAEHANEELDLLSRGELSYDDAQIVTSKDKKERIEENLARTGVCPDCGTVFSSKRRDSLSRHRQTSACEKAQRRGRPPTRFPKKPKGPSFHVLEVDGEDDIS